MAYIFGGSTGETAESIKRKREWVRAMLESSIGQQPRTVGDGIAVIGRALAGRIGQAVLNKQEKEGTAAAMKAAGGNSYIRDLLLGNVGGGGAATGASLAPGNVGAGPAGKDYFSAIKSAESGGNPNAKNPKSSATGLYQFTDGTWDAVARAHPDLGLTPDGRRDPQQQERAIRAFTADNAKVLASAGIAPTGGNLYAAHFLGAGGARSVLSQPDNASVASIVGQGVVKANPFLARMTVGDFKRWTASKGGNDTLAGGEANDTLGGRTLQGPPLYRPFNPNERRDNRDGTYSTEVSTTWQTPDGQWKNIPSLWMGPQGPKQFDPGDEQGILGAARNYEQINGPTFNSFPTLQEAEAAAVARSRAGGAGAGNGQLRETWGQPDPQRFGHGIDTRTGAPASFDEPNPERFGPAVAPKGDRLASAFQAQPLLTPQGVPMPQMAQGMPQQAPVPQPRPQMAPPVDPMQTAAVQPQMRPRGIVSPRAEDNGYVSGPGAAMQQPGGQGGGLLARLLMRQPMPQPAQGQPMSGTGGTATAPGGGGNDEMMQMYALIDNPLLPESYRTAIVEALKQKQEQADPAYQADLAYKRAQTAALEAPKPTETYRTLTDAEEKQYGLDPANAYQIGADNKIQQIGGGGVNVNVGDVKVPAGYRPLDPNNPGAGVEPIPGGPAEAIPAEVAGRLGLAKSFIDNFPALESAVGQGGLTGPYDRAMASQGWGQQGELYRQIQTGQDALRRMLTGAGMPVAEADEYLSRYMPGFKDDANSALSKIRGLKTDIENAADAIGKGRGGSILEMMRKKRGDAPAGAEDPLGIR